MIDIGAKDLEQHLDFPSLTDAIKQVFLSKAEIPERHHHTIPVPGRQDATLLLMPAWIAGQYIGLKTATIFPSNADENIPSVMATYLLLDGSTGDPLATIAGKPLTALRTAATSALVSDMLSLPHAATMTMVGAGALAKPLVRAHSSVRGLTRILLWNRSPDRLNQIFVELKAEGYPVEIAHDLEAAVRSSDIVSCATLSRAALVRGAWVKPGTHLDLVGAYTREMRETDAQAVAKSRVFVDTYAGCTAEAGDLIQAAESGHWDFSQIEGDLVSLVGGEVKGRSNTEDISLFKSVGTALEDLAAATLAYTRIRHVAI